jgi:hypothetical protein
MANAIYCEDIFVIKIEGINNLKINNEKRTIEVHFFQSKHRSKEEGKAEEK